MFSFEVGSLLNIAVVLGAGLAVSVMMIWVERRFLGHQDAVQGRLDSAVLR